MMLGALLGFQMLDHGNFMTFYAMEGMPLQDGKGFREIIHAEHAWANVDVDNVQR
jgi:hypothetical protein